MQISQYDLTSKHRIAGAAIAVALALASTPANAQQELKFSGPVKIFAGFAAGGQSDLLARIVADRLRDKLGRSVVVENKTGAGGRIAVEAIKASPPDGSALAIANIAQMSTAPLVFTDLTYDPLKDFTPIAKAVDFQVVLATGKLTQTAELKGLVAWLKANPDKNSSGVPALGGLPHLFGIELGKATGLQLQAIPYRGGAPIAAAILQGDIAMGWAGVGDFIEQHKAGTMKIVASTGKTRSPQLPDVPTFLELGFPSNEPNGWIGYFGPKGLPTDIAAMYEREIIAALKDPAIAKKLVEYGFIVTAEPGTAVTAQIEADFKKWKPVVEAAGLGGSKQ